MFLFNRHEVCLSYRLDQSLPQMITYFTARIFCCMQTKQGRATDSLVLGMDEHWQMYKNNNVIQ